ncbi:MAG: peptide ABC transporter substrate-binding protein [Lachnospiraceae bacterium]|nr:peptide ABC transporter substrate-binding protein [Lachnospiraceae bacterium]
MKKLVALLLAGAMCLSLVACGDSAQTSNTGTATDTASDTASDTAATTDSTSADTADTTAASDTAAAEDTTTEGNSISVCLASEPASIDPALNSAVDGATLLVHLFSGLAKWDQTADGTLTLVADAATELPEGVENEDGTVTYTYTLRDGLKWSDGQDVTANDFVFAWNRAASDDLAADYGYMFEVVDGYDEVAEGSADSMNIKAVDDKTIEVTLKNAVAYWNELLAFPTYFPVREDVVANESWATDPSTFVCNGAYTMTKWDHNSLITLTKNANFADADSITMDEINFYLSDDANNMLTNFENGSWQMIDDVPTNEIAALKDKYPDEFVVAGQLGTYYVCWNVNEDILPAGSGLSGADAEKARAEIRNAVSLLFDRNYIVEEIGQAGQVPAASFVAMGLTDADGSQFYNNANGGKGGYYAVDTASLQSNFDEAVEVLKKYYTYDESTGQFTDFPTMTYLYNTSEGHKAIGEYLQSALAQVGITMNLENQEWNTFLETRKNGDYSIARNGWLADYNDPICFLDMWVTASGNNDVQFGKGDNASVKAYSIDLTDLGYDTNVTDGTWAETYDVVISDVKTCTDSKTRYELMHKAEDLLMSTGCICPLYFYTDIYMLDSSVQGFFSNPLGYKYFMYCHY